MTVTQPVPDWYDDPEHPGALRYWDGAAWTADRAPAPVRPVERRMFLPSHRLGIASVVAVLAVAAVDLAAAAASYLAATDGIEPAPGAAPSAAEAVAMGGVVVRVPLLAVAGIVTVLWLRRARRNVEALRPTFAFRRGRDWTWAGWIVPIVNLWFPYQVVRGIEDGSTPSRRGGWVGPWWAAYLLYSATGGLAVIAASATDPQAAALLVTLRIGVVVVAAALWARIVQRVLAAQTRLGGPLAFIADR